MKISSKECDVYLETIDAKDVKAIVKNINDPEILSNINDPPIAFYTYGEAVQFIGYTKYANIKEFHMGIFSDSALMGMCALFNISYKDSELGFWLGKEYRGGGNARKALKLLISFGFGNLGLERIYAKVLLTNYKSIRLLKAMRFVYETTDANRMTLSVKKGMDTDYPAISVDSV